MGFKTLNNTFQLGKDKYKQINIPDFPLQYEKILWFLHMVPQKVYSQD